MKSLPINVMVARRKVAIWASVVTMASMTLLPVAANAAGQLTARKTAVGSSAPSAATTYTSTFTLGTSGQTLGSLKVEICDSPLQTTGCAAAAGATGVSMSAATLGSVTGATGAGTWTIGTKTATSALINKSSNDAQTGTPTLVVTLNSVTNPSGINTSYYVRVSTYTATAGGGTNTDFGAMALSTTRDITVAANVQESLTFCVGVTGTSCADVAGTSVSIGTGADNVLSTSTSGAVSKMFITTNATTGYAISYTTTSVNSGTFASTATNALTSANNQTMATCTGTAGCFGLNIVAANTGVTGSAAVGGAAGFVAPTITTGYGTADTYKFVPGATSDTIATISAPTVRTDYTVSYAAQAGSLTKPGAYAAVFNYVATGTF